MTKSTMAKVRAGKAKNAQSTVESRLITMTTLPDESRKDRHRKGGARKRVPASPPNTRPVGQQAQAASEEVTIPGEHMRVTLHIEFLCAKHLEHKQPNACTGRDNILTPQYASTEHMDTREAASNHAVQGHEQGNNRRATESSNHAVAPPRVQHRSQGTFQRSSAGNDATLMRTAVSARFSALHNPNKAPYRGKRPNVRTPERQGSECGQGTRASSTPTIELKGGSSRRCTESSHHNTAPMRFQRSVQATLQNDDHINEETQGGNSGSNEVNISAPQKPVPFQK